jgi:hypothetical protein
MQVRLATKEDADAIWKFWNNQKDPFRCAPGRKFVTREQLDEWLNGQYSVALVEEDGILLTDSFEMATGKSFLTNVSKENFAVCVPLVFQWEKELTGINPWGFCGFVPSVAMYCSAGWVERDDGMIEWVG